MTRPYVVTKSEHARVPFLRGILTRSLQEADLSFDDAYEVASQVRQQLQDEPEIDAEELRERVATLLEARYGSAVADRYRSPAQPGGTTILVKDSEGHLTPFSRGLHMRFLGASGLTPVESARVTSRIYDHLQRMEVEQIATNRLSFLTYLAIRKSLGARAASNFLAWSAFAASGQPLLILIGGTIGCGKSTVATALAHRLDIVRIQSTDMLREVMRIMMPERLVPVLHASSFEAWRRLPHADQVLGDPAKDEKGRLIEEGYRSQAELVTVACDSVLNRARKERVSLIIEGVHIQPAFGESLRATADAIVVPIELTVLKQKELKRRIKGRGANAPKRRAQRYLESFDAIWQLQTYLLSEADRCDVPIVANGDLEQTVEDIVLLIMARLHETFSVEPRDVFGLPPAKSGRAAQADPPAQAERSAQASGGKR